MSVWTPDRINAARIEMEKWLGTPHVNRIAEVGVGVDCIKFVLAVFRSVGVIPHVDFYGYNLTAGMWKESTNLQDTMLRCLHAEWVTADYKFGDIFILRTGKRSAHCGIYTDDGYIWHALGGRCVTKSDFSVWKREIIGMVRVVKDGFKLDPRAIQFD